jgi:hypothetical protein
MYFMYPFVHMFSESSTVGVGKNVLVFRLGCQELGGSRGLEWQGNIDGRQGSLVVEQRAIGIDAET